MATRLLLLSWSLIPWVILSFFPSWFHLHSRYFLNEFHIQLIRFILLIYKYFLRYNYLLRQYESAEVLVKLQTVGPDSKRDVEFCYRQSVISNWSQPQSPEQEVRTFWNKYALGLQETNTIAFNKWKLRVDVMN